MIRKSGLVRRMKVSYLVIVFMLVSSPVVCSMKLQTKHTNWQVQINCSAGGGNTYCIMGEKWNASDGVDMFDVPHPPFEPPGRAFIYFSHPAFPVLYQNIWMEYQHHSSNALDDSVVWNLTTYYIPMDGQGGLVQLQWSSSSFLSTGYHDVYLCFDGAWVDMKTISSFSFFSPAYARCHLLVVMSK